MKRLPQFLLAALCVAAVTLPHSPADACKPRRIKVSTDVATLIANPTRQQTNRLARDAVVLDEATDALNDGDNERVIRVLYARYGQQLNAWALNAEVFGERERSAVLMVALAVLRTEGALGRHASPPPLTGRLQADNVRWAIRAMEGLAFVGAAAERHVAEAWARDPELTDAALAKLDRLSKQGGLPSRFQRELHERLRTEARSRTLT